MGGAGALSTSATEAARLAVKLSPSAWGVCVGVPKLRAKREGFLHSVRCEGAFGDGGELSVVVVAVGVELLGVSEGLGAWECVFAGRGDFEACLAVTSEREGSLGGAEGGFEGFLALGARRAKRKIRFGEVAPIQCAFQRHHSSMTLGPSGEEGQRGRVQFGGGSGRFDRFSRARYGPSRRGEGFLCWC